MKQKLLKCPFCGHKKIEVYVENYDLDSSVIYSRICVKCRANGPWKDTEQQAIDAWNKRS